MNRRLRTLAVILVVNFAVASGAHAQRSVKTPAPAAARKAAHVAVQEFSFHSDSLGREMKYMAILPQGYAESARHYPVLYLLHGWNGDYTNWVKLTNVVADAKPYPFIIITPNAGNSWYINSNVNPQERVEDYIIRDLLREVDQRLRTIASPHRRAIAGLSMGGYGAVLYALKHSDLFQMAGSISGAFDGPVGIESVLPQLQPSLLSSYGPMGDPSRAANDVYTLAASSATSLPYLVLECGSADLLLPSNRRFVEILAAQKIAYEYHESPGAHTWSFWDGSLPLLLEAVKKRIGQKEQSN